MLRTIRVLMMASILPMHAYAAGLEAGQHVPSYSPKHLSGPDKGTKECPPCKYAAGPLLQIFINTETAENTKALAEKLEAALKAADALRGVVVMMNETSKPDFEAWATEWKLEKTGLCYITFGIRSTVVREYKLGSAKNMIVVSNAKKIVRSFEDAGVAELEKALELLRK